MPYDLPSNLTNITALLTYVNSITNNAAVTALFVLMPMIIVAVASIPFGLHVSVIMGLFTGTLMAIFLSVAGLVDASVVLILLVFTGVSVITALFLKRQRGGSGL